MMIYKYLVFFMSHLLLVINFQLGYKKIQGCLAKKVKIRGAESTLHTGASLVVFVCLFIFEFLARKAAVEKYIICQQHRNPSNAPFLHIDILVLPVVTSLRCSSNAFRDESPHSRLAWPLRCFDIHEFLLPHWYDWCHLGVLGICYQCRLIFIDKMFKYIAKWERHKIE